LLYRDRVRDGREFRRGTQLLTDLHAILDISKDQIRPLRLHHPSFRDFLLEKERCRDLNFWVEEIVGSIHG
jgi:hypothetical protein